MYIPYGRQSISEEDIQAVVDVLRSDYLTTGPKVTEFENTVANYVGAKYAVAVSNGTAALHIACLAAGIQPGDEVIVSPITFAASANCVLYCGGKPVFADIKPDTYNIDPEEKHVVFTTFLFVSLFVQQIVLFLRNSINYIRMIHWSASFSQVKHCCERTGNVCFCSLHGLLHGHSFCEICCNCT